MTLNELSAAAESFPLTPTFPVLFLGHGSPMNAIEDTPFRRAWQELGLKFDDKWPKPKLILCISGASDHRPQMPLNGRKGSAFCSTSGGNA